MKQTVRLGLLGLGTVGRGVLRLLRDNGELIRQRSGVGFEITRIAVRDPARDRGVEVPVGLLTTDASKVVGAGDVDVVVELIGGCDPARRLVLEAMAAGKHVVTANKALIAEHGHEIRQAAARAGVELGIEASVCGGIPVIKAIRESLAGNRIVSIFGIINGTSNYILTKMSEEGRDFDEVLKEAQEAGYAEADPAFDIGGIDSAHKLAILVNLAFGIPVDLADIHTEGITGVTPLDIRLGREFGYTLKSLAIAKAVDGQVEARVHPTFVPDDYPIAQIGGVYNAVQIVGDAVGDLMLSGRGAGEMPTASSVVGDLVDIGRFLRSGASSSGAPAPAGGATIRHVEDITSLYYLRFMVEDKPGVLSEIAGVLGRYNISIESVIQKGRAAAGVVPLVTMTHTALERDIRRALVEIDRLPPVADKTVLIRVEAGD